MNAVCLLGGTAAHSSNVGIPEMNLEDQRDLIRLKCYIATERDNLLQPGLRGKMATTLFFRTLKVRVLQPVRLEIKWLLNNSLLCNV